MNLNVLKLQKLKPAMLKKNNFFINSRNQGSGRRFFSAADPFATKCKFIVVRLKQHQTF